MDALGMIKREPFYEILQSTTNEYGKAVFSEETNFSEEIASGKKKMYFFMVPSFASVLPISKKMRRALYSEYNIRGSKIKFLIGKLGVFAVTHSGKLFASKTFCFSENSQALKNVMISPCNRSIRYFNFEKGYVDCYVKSMYSNAYMQNQLQFRLQEKYDFVPKVISYGDRWYREEIMYGNALARVTNDADYLSSQETALSFIKQIADDTLENISSNDYLFKLEKDYFQIIKAFSAETEKELYSLGKTLFLNLHNAIDNVNMQIPVVLSHGDLQGGNIWLQKDKKTVIYDWETVKPRSVWFDPATLLLKLHSSEFIENLESLVTETDKIFINDQKRDYLPEEKKIISLIIYIENILFYLDDMAQLPKEYSVSVCNAYINAMKQDFERRGFEGE